MTNTSPQKPSRKLTALELSAPARGALRRFKRFHGLTFTYAVERGLKLLEREFFIGEPMPAADRQKLGLKIDTAESLLAAKGKRGAK